MTSNSSASNFRPEDWRGSLMGIDWGPLEIDPEIRMRVIPDYSVQLPKRPFITIRGHHDIGGDQVIVRPQGQLEHTTKYSHHYLHAERNCVHALSRMWDLGRRGKTNSRRWKFWRNFAERWGKKAEKRMLKYIAQLENRNQDVR